ncbi:hypothetical protein TWF481_010375 [Arthrobotrys musiformis]|uniref:Uncharacterized protein n=1 Tax=Arthrobotrys musiformis TaxID=47236 RepID=A0AAV9W2S3_9PEZI
MIFCCVKQAGTTNAITPESNQFYLARIAKYHAGFSCMPQKHKAAMTWLIAILEMATQQYSPSILQKLQISIKENILPEGRMAKIRFLEHTIKSVNPKRQVPSHQFVQSIIASLEDVQYDDFSFEKYQPWLNLAGYRREFYLLERLSPSEVERYDRILQFEGLTAKIRSQVIQAEDCDKVIGMYNAFIEQNTKKGEGSCNCKPTTIMSYVGISVAMICKPGICEDLTRPDVGNPDESLERQNLPLYDLQVRFKAEFPVPNT